MSFDLLIKSQFGRFDKLSHDIVLSNNVQVVKNSEKLTQDLQKILLTTRNYFHTNYGTIIETIIGTNYGLEQTINLLKNSVVSSLIYLQNLQKNQATYQQVSALETLSQVLSVNVTYLGASSNPSQQDKTTFKIAISVLNGLQQIITFTQNLSLG